MPSPWKLFISLMNMFKGFQLGETRERTEQDAFQTVHTNLKGLKTCAHNHRWHVLNGIRKKRERNKERNRLLFFR